MIIPVHKPTPSEILDIAFTCAKLEFQKGTPYSHGICSVLIGVVSHLGVFGYTEDFVLDEITSSFKEWPKFSGSVSYPVPAPDNNLDPVRIYVHNRFNSWDTSFEYVRLRYEMIEWTINKLKEEECSMQA